LHGHDVAEVGSQAAAPGDIHAARGSHGKNLLSVQLPLVCDAEHGRKGRFKAQHRYVRVEVEAAVGDALDDGGAGREEGA